MIAVPILTTRNLILRPIDEKDIAALYALFSSEQVMEFMDVERFTNVSEAAQMVSFFRDKLQSGEGMRWGISLSARNELIGTCGFHHINKAHYKAEVGYDLLPAWWGKGVMTQAISRILQYGFEELHFNRIEAVVDPTNNRSFQLLERIGFQREGLLRQAFYEKNGFADAYMYSLLNRDYKNELHF